MSTRMKRKADDATDGQPADNGGVGSQRREFAVRRNAYHERCSALNLQFYEALKKRREDQRSGRTHLVSYIDICNVYEREAKKIRSQYADIIKALETAEMVAPEGARAAAKRVSGLYMIGQNDNGQLGLGDNVTERYYPYPLVINDLNVAVRIAAVALGGMHSVALSDTGDVYTWGVNDTACLGREVPVDPDSPGNNMTGYFPGKVSLPAGARVVQISAGDGHTAALTGDGRVFEWGLFIDTSGPFALTPTVKKGWSPVEIYSPASADEKVKRIASGVDHILALTAAGDVLSWGCGEKGRLGRLAKEQADAKEEERSVETLKPLLLPKRIPGLQSVVHIACGWYCSYAITEGKQVYAWGLNNYGQLGLPRITSAQVDPYYFPTLSPSLSGRNVVAISSGEHHTLALTGTGEVLSLGRATYGRLGRSGPGIDVNSDEPVSDAGVRAESAEKGRHVVGGFDAPATSIAAGGSVSATVTEKGSVYFWGFNGNNQQGRGSDDSDAVVPTKLHPTKNFSATGCVYVAIGGQHSAIMASGAADHLQVEASVQKRQRN